MLKAVDATNAKTDFGTSLNTTLTDVSRALATLWVPLIIKDVTFTLVNVLANVM